MTYDGQDLYNAAYSIGSCGYSLDKCLFLITSECGELTQLDFRQIVEGHAEGQRDWQVHRTEFEYIESTEPSDPWEDCPF